MQHELVLNVEALAASYRTECEALFTAEEDIQDCVDQRVNDFIEHYTYSIGG